MFKAIHNTVVFDFPLYSYIEQLIPANTTLVVYETHFGGATDIKSSLD